MMSPKTMVQVRGLASASPIGSPQRHDGEGQVLPLKGLRRVKVVAREEPQPATQPPVAAPGPCRGHQKPAASQRRQRVVTDLAPGGHSRRPPVKEPQEAHSAQCAGGRLGKGEVAAAVAPAPTGGAPRREGVTRQALTLRGVIAVWRQAAKGQPRPLTAVRTAAAEPAGTAEAGAFAAPLMEPRRLLSVAEVETPAATTPAGVLLQRDLAARRAIATVLRHLSGHRRLGGGSACE